MKLFFAQITIFTSGSPFFKIQSTNILAILQLREPSQGLAMLAPQSNSSTLPMTEEEQIQLLDNLPIHYQKLLIEFMPYIENLLAIELGDAKLVEQTSSSLTVEFEDGEQVTALKPAILTPQMEAMMLQMFRTQIGTADCGGLLCVNDKSRLHLK